MAGYYFLDDNDIALLRGLVERERSRSPNAVPRSRQDQPEEWLAPELYAALTPSGGVPALTEGPDPGSLPGVDDTPGTASVPLYRRTPTATGFRMDNTGRSITVNNLSTSAVAGDQWVLVARDKYGQWYIIEGMANPSSVVGGGGSGGAAVFRPHPGGRLTLSSTDPTDEDVVAGSTIFYLPYVNNKIALFNGTTWAEYTFTSPSIDLSTLSAATNYDIFAYASGSTVNIEATAWTNNTTRATELVRQDGVLSKDGALTRMYLGSIRTIASDSDFTRGNRFIYNYYNRLRFIVANNTSYIDVPGGNPYSGGWVGYPDNLGFPFSVLVGVAEEAIHIHATCSVRVDTAEVGTVEVGMSIQDSIAGNIAPMNWFKWNAVTNQPEITLTQDLVHHPSIGVHTYTMIVRTGGGQIVYFDPDKHADFTIGTDHLFGTWRC